MGDTSGAREEPEEALKAAAEAVEHHRALARGNPGALPDLVMSLNTLGTCLVAQGRNEEAVEALGEAVELCRGQARYNPDAFQPYLARSLYLLGRGYRGMQDGLPAMREAVNLYRTLAQRNPDALQPDPTMRPSWLDIRLDPMGRGEKLVKATVEAVEFHRVRAQRDPDAVQPDLARSLHELGEILTELSLRQEALTATQEAVSLYRTRVRLHPEELQSSLGALCARLRDLGRYEEALKAAAEALELFWAQVQPFTRFDSPRFMEYAQKGMHLGLSRIHTLGALLTELGGLDEALTAAPELVELPRALAQREPDAFLLDLAGNLQQLADWMDTAEIPDVAAQAAGAAVVFFLAAFQPGSTSRLGNLGAIWNKLGRHEGWQITIHEVVGLGRALAQRDPEAIQPRLASILDMLGRWLHSTGRHEEALTSTQEAVKLYRALAQPFPDKTQFDLVSSLVKLGMLLGELERDEEALAPFQEALDTLWPFLNHFHESWELAEDLLSHLRFLHSLLERPLPVALEERGAAFERLKKSGRVLLS
jgi:tetratricopeptide (TPR) repeat protein